MSTHAQTARLKPLDLTRWRNLPNALLVGGGALALLGAALNLRQFAFSWLLAFMFTLSLVMGALFLVLMHHLFDAGWSVPIRRFIEHLACQVSTVLLLFIPVGLLAFKIYPWMTSDPHLDHALHAKQPLFTVPMFYVISLVCFALWILLSRRLRYYSLEQDRTGAASCTHRMRRWASVGIVIFAFSLTLAVILWMKGIMHQWFSTMYGVVFFAGSTWLTLATVYFITMILVRTGKLRELLHEHQFYFLGTLLFAFTVFYAYVAFSQYFIIWNANMPEETFWYALREKGTWYYVGLLLIFGHFFLPFLSLLRIDAKHFFPLMTFLTGWAWLMHYVDMSFNIMPELHKDGFPFLWIWLDLGCIAFMVALVFKGFARDLAAHPMYPLRDPRLSEALGLYHPVASPISGGEMDEIDSDEETMTGTGSDLSPMPRPEGGAR
jgi:hypothetical protein